MEDKQIVDMFLAREDDAIKETANKYGKRLGKISYGITDDFQIAEECVNDTYLETWNRIPPNKPYTYFYAFLARIVRHISIDCCRKSNAVKRQEYLVELSDELLESIPSRNSVQDTADETELVDLISKYLLSIDKEKRTIFTRRYFYLNTVDEIARLCSISESKVKTTLFRVRNGLKEYLSKEGYFL